MTKMNPNSRFVALSSVGSQAFFPDNTPSSFTNVLAEPLGPVTHLRLVDCIVSSKDPLLVCSNLVAPSLFNEKLLPILSVFPIRTEQPYLALNAASNVKVWLLDLHGQPVALNGLTFLVIHVS